MKPIVSYVKTWKNPKWFNLLGCGDEIWLQRSWSALVHIMACPLFGTGPLHERMMTYSQVNHRELTSVKFESKNDIFYWTNTIESGVCKLAAILFRPQWVKLLFTGNGIGLHLICWMGLVYRPKLDEHPFLMIKRSSKIRLDPSHKSHNAPDKISHNAPFCNRNVHTCAHFCYKNVALWDMAQVHCGICEIVALRVYEICIFGSIFACSN